MTSVILASQSPRRKKLLEQINLKFRVQVSSVEESFDADAAPEVIVQTLATRKACDIAEDITNALVIGADTLVILHDKILEKPSSPAQAVEVLTSLSANTHQVFTGVALIKTDDEGNIRDECTFFERTHVTFGALTTDEIERYVQTGSPMDKAGAYGIQDDWGTLFVERIEGDYNNVVGFPLFRFYQKMKQFAPECLPDEII